MNPETYDSDDLIDDRSSLQRRADEAMGQLLKTNPLAAGRLAVVLGDEIREGSLGLTDLPLHVDEKRLRLVTALRPSLNEDSLVVSFEEGPLRIRVEEPPMLSEVMLDEIRSEGVNLDHAAREVNVETLSKDDINPDYFASTEPEDGRQSHHIPVLPGYSLDEDRGVFLRPGRQQLLKDRMEDRYADLEVAMSLGGAKRSRPRKRGRVPSKRLQSSL